MCEIDCRRQLGVLVCVAVGFIEMPMNYECIVIQVARYCLRHWIVWSEDRLRLIQNVSNFSMIIGRKVALLTKEIAVSQRDVANLATSLINRLKQSLLWIRFLRTDDYCAFKFPGKFPGFPRDCLFGSCSSG